MIWFPSQIAMGTSSRGRVNRESFGRFLAVRATGQSMWRVLCPRLGDEGLSGKIHTDGTNGDGKKPPKPPRGGGGRGGSGSDIGRALRSAYDDTVRESVPDEFMDLLGKLD
ncbi:MAG: NepR family anti-sigma factor [Sphingomicrobium sp.]